MSQEESSLIPTGSPVIDAAAARLNAAFNLLAERVQRADAKTETLRQLLDHVDAELLEVQQKLETLIADETQEREAAA